MDPFMFQHHHAMQANSGYDHHRTIAPTSKQRPEGPENENRGRKLKEVATHKISAKVFEMSGMNHDFPIYQTAIDHVARAFAGKPYMDQWPVQQAGKATKAERRESQGAVLEIAGIMRQFAETLTTHLDVVSTLLVKLHGALAMVTARFYRKHKANDAVMVKSIFVDVTFNTFIVNTWRIDLTVLRTRFASFDWANNFDAYRLSKDCREWENPLSLVVNHIELQSLQDRISSVTMQNEHLAKENTQLKQEVQALRNQLQQARGTTPPCGLQSYHFVPQSNGGSSHGGSSQPGTPQGADAKRPMFDFQSITPTYKTDTSVSAPNSLLAWQPNMNEATFNVNGFQSRGGHIPAGSGSDTSDPHSLFSQTGFSQSRGGLPTTQIVLGNGGHALGHIGASSSTHGSVSAPMVRSLTPSSGSVSAPNTPPHSNPMVATQYVMQQHQPPQQERHFAGPARMIGNVALGDRTRSSSELAITAPSLGSRPVPILAGGGIFDAPMATTSPYSHSSTHASMEMSQQQLLLAQASLEQQQQQMLQSQRQPHVDMSGWPQAYAYDSNPLPPHIAYGEDVEME